MGANVSSVKIAVPNEDTSDRKQDRLWVLSLYGTAIGAGVLFLPIDAGSNGIWPVLIILLLAFPMTYLSHQALCRFVLSASGNQTDITGVVEQYFGSVAGNLLTFLYFFAIYPILLMYSVAITNTMQNFIIHQMNLEAPPRALLALILILSLMSIVRFGQEMIIKAMSVLVYPFVTILVMLSIYLVPHWNGAVFHHTSTHSGHNMLTTLWLVIPVMVFSFNHSPIISSFAVSQKQRFGNQADAKSSQILKYSHIMMITTVMMFVLSCVFSLSPQDLALAKQQNISILSYLANHFDSPLVTYMAPVVAFIAIAKSFLGHYLGAREGIHGLLTKSLRSCGKSMSPNHIKWTIELFIVLTCWAVATLNPNILNMIETLGGPIIASILFLMPMYAIAKVPAMKKYAAPLANKFITVMGLIAVSATLYGLFS